jgi:uncharacterized protein with PQ loop repeat
MKKKTIKRPIMGDVWKHYYAVGMLWFVTISKVFFVLQIFEIFRMQSTYGVSLSAYIFSVASSLLWVFYGAFILQKPNAPILLNNVLGFFLSAITIMVIMAFRA